MTVHRSDRRYGPESNSSGIADPLRIGPASPESNSDADCGRSGARQAPPDSGCRNLRMACRRRSTGLPGGLTGLFPRCPRPRLDSATRSCVAATTWILVTLHEHAADTRDGLDSGDASARGRITSIQARGTGLRLPSAFSEPSAIKSRRAVALIEDRPRPPTEAPFPKASSGPDLGQGLRSATIGRSQPLEARPPSRARLESYYLESY